MSRMAGMRLPIRWLYPTAFWCLLLSDVAGLVYPVVWARYLALLLGCTSYGVVAVLVAFMGGPLSMVTWASAEPAYGSQDHVHFTRTGYEPLGIVLLDALLEGFDPPGSAATPATAALPSPASDEDQSEALALEDPSDS